MDEINRFIVANKPEHGYDSTKWKINSIIALIKVIEQNEERMKDLASLVTNMQTQNNAVSEKLSQNINNLTSKLMSNINEIHELVEDNSRMIDRCKKIVPIKAPKLNKITLILFMAEVSDLDDDDKDEMAVYTYKAIYVKLIEKSADKFSSFNNKVDSLEDKIIILTTFDIEVEDVDAFVCKLEHGTDINVRKRDRCLLPVKLYRTYSIRSFLDYENAIDNISASIEFIKNLIPQIKHYR